MRVPAVVFQSIAFETMMTHHLEGSTWGLCKAHYSFPRPTWILKPPKKHETQGSFSIQGDFFQNVLPEFLISGVGWADPESNNAHPLHPRWLLRINCPCRTHIRKPNNAPSTFELTTGERRQGDSRRLEPTRLPVDLVQFRDETKSNQRCILIGY